MVNVFENADARDWKPRKIGEVAPVQTGFAFKSAWFTEEGGVRVLRNANIHQGFIDWSDLVCVRSDVSERFGAFALASGDIVLTLDRPLVANGLKVARVDVRDKPALLNQRVARFQVDTSAVDIEYLYAFLRSPGFSNAIRGHDQSLGVPHISPSQVENVELPLPSLMTQKRVVSELNICLNRVVRLMDCCREEAAAIETLPRTYLREAFKGVS
jgi:type I restriction enzyme S subunit